MPTPAIETDVEARRQALIELCNRVLADRRLIMVSNRGPVEHQVGNDGRLQARRGSGGLVTALTALTRHVDLSWIASAMGEGDRRAVQEAQGGSITPPLPGQRMSLRYVITPRRVYHKYYNVFCNPLLWFLQHYMWNSPYTPTVDRAVHDAWEHGYIPVNRAFAQEVVKEAQESDSPPVILLHDYHMYLTPGLVRHELPDAIIQHFCHIPWPSPTYWRLLPDKMRRPICESLLSADIVGFQTMRDVRSFLESCQAFLHNVSVNYEDLAVSYRGHTTLVRNYPVSIDVEELQHIASSSRAQMYEEHLSSQCREMVLVRVDRVEPSKNIVRGLRAFSLLLERYPEFQGKLTYLAFLVPSRTHIRQYQRYLNEIDNEINEMNRRFGTDDWTPILVFYENNYTQAVAGMRLYDVLMVNPVIDGMNLVAKEGPVVNRKDGVLILSESAGAYEQLQVGALPVSPTDIEGTVEALHQALTMPEAERAARATLLREAVSREDATFWLTRQMEDIASLIEQ